MLVLSLLFYFPLYADVAGRKSYEPVWIMEFKKGKTPPLQQQKNPKHC